jgi:hypothetical protein
VYQGPSGHDDEAPRANLSLPGPVGSVFLPCGSGGMRPMPPKLGRPRRRPCSCSPRRPTPRRRSAREDRWAGGIGFKLDSVSCGEGSGGAEAVGHPFAPLRGRTF